MVSKHTFSLRYHLRGKKKNLKVLNFLLTSGLVPCMFELTDVYYINLILIILSSSCFPLKLFLRSSKLWSIKLTNMYVCLIKLLPTMAWIWLNQINVSDYSENVENTDISVWDNTYISVWDNTDISRRIIKFFFVL